MDSITAKQWREMSTPDIIASMDTAIVESFQTQEARGDLMD
jgi:hypothetical protein